MFETYLTVVGNVVTNPQRRETQTGEEVISFRVGSTARYRPADSDDWRDGSSLFLTVSCWRRLIAGVGASVKKGTPVIVHGQVRSRQYTTKDGEVRTDYEMRASAVGLDLARSIVQRLDRKPPAVVAESSIRAAEPGGGAGGHNGAGSERDDSAEPGDSAEAGDTPEGGMPGGFGDGGSAAAGGAGPDAGPDDDTSAEDAAEPDLIDA